MKYFSPIYKPGKNLRPPDHMNILLIILGSKLPIWRIRRLQRLYKAVTKLMRPAVCEDFFTEAQEVDEKLGYSLIH